MTEKNLNPRYLFNRVDGDRREGGHCAMY